MPNRISKTYTAKEGNKQGEKQRFFHLNSTETNKKADQTSTHIRHKNNSDYYQTYTTPAVNGAVDVNRTHDLLITNQLLYQLSYNG